MVDIGGYPEEDKAGALDAGLALEAPLKGVGAVEDIGGYPEEADGALDAGFTLEAALKGVGAVDDKGGYELPVVFFFCAPKDVGVVFVVED